MLIIKRQEDEDFLSRLHTILAGWSELTVSGTWRTELARRLDEVLTRAQRVSSDGPVDIHIEKAK